MHLDLLWELGGSLDPGPGQPPYAQAHKAHSCYGQTCPSCRSTHCPFRCPTGAEFTKPAHAGTGQGGGWGRSPKAAVLHSSPFRLSPSSQQQFSPWVCPLNPKFQHPAPTHTSGCTSQGGGLRAVAPTVCAVLSLFCLSQTSCGTLL